VDPRGEETTLEQILAEGREAQVRVMGDSMAPTLEPGADVRVVRRRPLPGEVVLLRSPDGFTLHRLVAILGPRWVHAGDAPGASGGLCRPGDVVAVAELPTRVLPLRERIRLVTSAILGAGLARLGLSALLVLALVASTPGCKRAAPPPRAALPPEVVEVRVTDRTPPEEQAGLDLQALRARAVGAIAQASRVRVTDGGVGGGPRYRLRVEVRTEQAKAPGSAARVQRALVAARLEPVQADPGALVFEQDGVAERELAPSAGPGEVRATMERAVEDVVKGLGAKLKLSAGDAAALVAAIDGADDELRVEAMRLCRERKERAAVPALLRLLKSEDADTRDGALGALAEIGDRRAVKPITELARFRDVADLPKVLDALAALGGDEARAYLEFVASGHDSPEIRDLAKRAIEHLERRTAAAR
jgi:hypothetical protein